MFIREEFYVLNVYIECFWVNVSIDMDLEEYIVVSDVKVE